MKSRKTYHVILIFLVIQTFCAAAAGFLAFYHAGRNCMKPEIFFFDRNITYAGYDDIKNTVSEILSEYTRKNHVNIRIADHDYNLNLSELGYRYNVEELIKKRDSVLIDKRYSLTDMLRYISGKWRVELQPPVEIDMFLLEEKFNTIALELETKPDNAQIYIEDDAVVIAESSPGLKIDARKASWAASGLLCRSKPVENIILDNPDKGVVYEQPALHTSFYNGLDSVISDVSVDISICDRKRAYEIITYLNGAIIENYNGDAGMFKWWTENSANERKFNTDLEYQTELILSSLLYQAVLKAGLDTASIKREANSFVLDFIKPGFDVKLEDSEFSFINTLGFRIMLVAGIDEDSAFIKVLGPETAGRYELIASIDEDIKPGLITVMDTSVDEDEELVIADGIEGHRVSVYRYRMSPDYSGQETAELNLLYYDVYEPVSRMVRICDLHASYDK